jgi:gluconolactonase
MKKILILACATLILAAAPQNKKAAASATPGPTVVIDVPPPSNEYALGPDSLPHPDVPAGKTFSFEMAESKIYPGSTRNITVYIPADYHADKPACLYVGLDGLGFRVPNVFDNLIAQHAMPVTIAIGVSSGNVASTQAAQNPRFDRSFEFDSVTDRLARFLIEEVLPAVEKHTTPSGERIVLSHNPNDHAIGGGSTGGIGAFTAAFERPDVFRRVFTSIGTFVGMRGGDHFNVLVRKTEPKPIRVFMQDGVHDEWPGGPEMGDWWMSNQTMERALEFAGYDVRHVWGAGTHNGNQATAVFPDAMRWLWRDWPKPIQAGEPGNPALKPILEPTESWQVVAEGCSDAGYLAANPKGDVLPCSQSAPAGLVAFGADGKSYATKLIAPGRAVGGMTVRNNGDLYGTTDAGELWLVRANGKKVQLDRGLKGPSGIAFSPDGLWLFVAQSRSRWGMSYRVRPDGTLDGKEAFYDFEVPGWADDSGASSVWMDRNGTAYVATRMGVQIFDRNGRVVGILPMPGNLEATSLAFGGREFDWLYVLSGGKVYKRKVRSKGAPPWGAPITLPKWGAG